MSSGSTIAVSEELEVNGSATRFPFGKNWEHFLKYLDEERIVEAEKSLRTMLEVDSFGGKSFLDIGCGSGLFSLAAMRMGSERVHSFDYDIHSVACALELKRRYFAGAHNWTIQQGDVLDAGYLSLLGKFDIAYSWGVLHHTGNMWQALENAAIPVRPDGTLYIAIYDDRGLRSRYWRVIKEIYNKNRIARLAIILAHVPYLLGRDFVSRSLTGHLILGRGMSVWCDMKDWLGGYPFEVARPERILDLYKRMGFSPIKVRTCLGANNEYIFIKCAE